MELSEEHELGPTYREEPALPRLNGKLLQTLPKEGVKYDQEKPRMDLIPHEVMEALGSVLAYGAAKYGDHNWEDGMPWGRIFAALQRHAWAWHKGQDLDPESGLPHLWHLLANVCFLVAYQARGLGTDNRQKVLPKPAK